MENKFVNKFVKDTRALVIDNYLPREQFEELKNIICSDNFQWPWYYNKFVDDREKGETHEHFCFNHLVYDHYVQNSSFFEDFLPLINKINPNALIRVKVNAYPKNGDKIITHNSHIDYDFTHKGALFYLNTCNGKTILEDGTEIDSVANRILFFDSSRPHQSTNCTDAKMRFNININYF